MAEENKNHYTIQVNKPTFWILVVVAAVFVFAGVFNIVRDIRAFGWHHYTSGRFLSVHHNHQRLTADQIQSWMTFNFINWVFGLPPEYLKSGLNINSTKYPNLTIEAWAEQAQENVQTLTEKIKTLVKGYETTSPQPTGQ